MGGAEWGGVGSVFGGREGDFGCCEGEGGESGVWEVTYAREGSGFEVKEVVEGEGVVMREEVGRFFVVRRWVSWVSRERLRGLVDLYEKFILVLLKVGRKGLEVVAVGEGVCEGVRERGPRDVSETQYWGPVLSRGETLF